MGGYSRCYGNKGGDADGQGVEERGFLRKTQARRSDRQGDDTRNCGHPWVEAQGVQKEDDRQGGEEIEPEHRETEFECTGSCGLYQKNRRTESHSGQNKGVRQRHY